VKGGIVLGTSNPTRNIGVVVLNETKEVTFIVQETRPKANHLLQYMNVVGIVVHDGDSNCNNLLHPITPIDLHLDYASSSIHV
jgi:hypothetical protein